MGKPLFTTGWYDRIEALLALALAKSASSATGTNTVWTDVAPGTTIAPTGAQQALSCNTAGPGKIVVNLPAAPTNGREQVIRCTGNMLQPVLINAGAGTSIELLNAPGTFGASTWMPIQGEVLVLKYDATPGVTAWKIKGHSTAGTAGQPTYNPGWYAIANVGIAWDPANATGIALDSNTGAAGSPVLTFAEIVRRFGSERPQMGYLQNCLINQGTLANPSPQPAGQDPVFLEPILSGGGVRAILTVALASAGADFAAGALGGGYGSAGAVATAGGTEMTMAAVPGYVVAKTLLENTTRGSYAFVDSVSAGTAKLSQPQTTATLTMASGLLTFPAVDNDWVAGDNIRAWTCQATNLKRWSPLGSDRLPSTAPNAGLVLFARVVDTTGTNRSSYNHYNQCDWNVLSCCVMDTCTQMNGIGSRANGMQIWNCYLQQQTVPVGGNGPIILGGIVAGGLFVLANGFVTANNVVLHGANSFYGTDLTIAASTGLTTGGLFCDGSILWACPTGGPVSGANVWGTYSINVQAGCAYLNLSGGTFAARALLTTGAITIGSVATARAPSVSGTFVANGNTPVNVAPTGTDHFPANAEIAFSMNALGGTAAPVFFSATQAADSFQVNSSALNTSTYNWRAFGGSDNLTPANIDKYKGMYDEATGARFCNAA